jgi:hypothetical protein
MSAACVYCLQKAESAACAAVNPEMKNIGNKNAAADGSLFAISFPPPTLIPSP